MFGPLRSDVRGVRSVLEPVQLENPGELLCPQREGVGKDPLSRPTIDATRGCFSSERCQDDCGPPIIKECDRDRCLRLLLRDTLRPAAPRHVSRG